jgi:hypothetical protein
VWWVRGVDGYKKKNARKEKERLTYKRLGQNKCPTKSVKLLNRQETKSY